ncbi:MAG: Pr6Pr family membrane protein [Methyloceanibacter sp.]
MVVAVIYHYLLRQLWNTQGWELVADTIEHVVAPVLYVIDWLVFVPKRTLKVKSAFAWLAFPLAYAVYSLIHGPLTDFYPYPFIDVSKLGYAKVLTDMGMLILVFTALGLLLIAIDRGIGLEGRGRDRIVARRQATVAR